MLVVSANWAIGDGSLVRATAGWHGLLAPAVHRAATRAGFRRDGSYRPIEGVDLVLAGDTFDWLASAAWCGRTRPWHGGAAARAIQGRVAAAAVRRGRRLLAPLVRFGRRGLTLPAADARGRPGRGTVAVPVRVTLLVGDRDRALAEWPWALDRVPFALGAAWSDGRVTVRHGHEHDPACHGATERRGVNGGRPPTLAESVAVDLVAAFALRERERGADHAGLVRRLVRARPVALPAALAAWQAEAAPPLREWAAVADAWRRAVDRWHEAARREVPSCEVEFDALGSLAAWLADAARAGGETRPIPAAIERIAGSGPAAGGPREGLFLGHDTGAAGAPADAVPAVFAADAEVPGAWRMIAGVEPRDVVVTIAAAPWRWHRGGPVVDAA
jgi:hypothetical protein